MRRVLSRHKRRKRRFGGDVSIPAEDRVVARICREAGATYRKGMRA
jgi:hypothetical protein